MVVYPSMSLQVDLTATDTHCVEDQSITSLFGLNPGKLPALHAPKVLNTWRSIDLPEQVLPGQGVIQTSSSLHASCRSC